MEQSSISTITSLISTVGFPIVCCVFMWKFISTTLKEFTEAIGKNTAAINELVNSISRSAPESRLGEHIKTDDR